MNSCRFDLDQILVFFIMYFVDLITPKVGSPYSQNSNIVGWGDQEGCAMAAGSVEVVYRGDFQKTSPTGHPIRISGVGPQGTRPG
jgi:hypothetical protein